MSEEKRRVELPRALREIVRVLAEEGPQTYEELAQKLEKDETTIIRQVQKLIDMEICVKVEKEGKTAVALAEGVEVDEEGNVYLPSPFEDPMEKIKTLLEEAGVKGRKLRWIMRLVESNPESLARPEVLFDTLVGAGVRRQLAQQIVRAFFGTDIQLPVTPIPQRSYPPYPYYAHPYAYTGPVGPMPFDRELMRLEMRLERLMEELRERREERTAYPVVRRIRTDESGKPVEIIEEPAWLRSDDSTARLLLQLLQQQQRDRDELLKTVFALQQETSKTVEKILHTMQQIQQQTQQQLQQLLMEIEKRRLEDVARMKDEMHKRDIEWMERFYEREIKNLRETVEGMKSYYEEKAMRMLENLKRELEWQQKLRELEERRTLRDVIVSEIRELAKEGRETFKQLRQQVRDYIEMQMKQAIVRKEVPTVSEDERRRIIEALRKRGKQEEEKELKEGGEAETEVQLKVIK